MEMFKKISQVCFGVGAAVAVGTAGYTYYLQANAPEGFCPLNPSRPYMKIALALLVASLLIDLALGYQKKKLLKAQTETSSSADQDHMEK